MKKKSLENKRKRLRRRLERMWDRAEELIHRFFDQTMISPAGKSGGRKKNDPVSKKESLPLPKMTEFNVIVASIKRLQEARLSLYKEECAYETESGDDATDPESVQAEISRVLKALEKNGGGEEPDSPSMPD